MFQMTNNRNYLKEGAMDLTLQNMKPAQTIPQHLATIEQPDPVKNFHNMMDSVQNLQTQYDNANVSIMGGMPDQKQPVPESAGSNKD